MARLIEKYTNFVCDVDVDWASGDASSANHTTIANPSKFQTEKYHELRAVPRFKERKLFETAIDIPN
ncbi:MAG: hypothetical protein NPIRA04_14800 [Nitrospirales bacterium]|nr:MAG: hypothetical protein NPIRA04_14800 [Nitrospirales bacterium]